MTEACSEPSACPPPMGRIDEITETARFWAGIRQMIGRSEQACGDAGTTNLQFQALLTIAAFDGEAPPTVTDLAERLVLRHNSAVELSSRLEAGGWITRTRFAANRRKVLLALTNSGMRLVEHLLSAHQELATGPKPELA